MRFEQGCLVPSGQQTGDMSNRTDRYLRHLRATFPLRETILRAAIATVSPPGGSNGLDVGCGIGAQTSLLADFVGPAGHVTGVDSCQAFLDHARVSARETGLSDRAGFRQADANRLPFDDGSFDWAWSVDCVGYGTSNSVALVREMGRVVRPGGTVALLAWSSERLLPGHPLLEARLGATVSGLAPFGADMPEQWHFSRGLGWFREAGLEGLAARALAGSVHAPLTPELRVALSALVEMRWPGVETYLSKDDHREYRRLCDPESPDCILDHPDYFAFFTYSLLWGKVPA